MTLKGQIQGHVDFEALYLVKEQLGHMLLLNINRKTYMGSPMTLSHLDFGLNFTYQGHSDSEALYLVNEQT